MRIETITRFSFIGDEAERHAKKKRAEYIDRYGKELVSRLTYSSSGRISFEVVIQVY